MIIILLNLPLELYLHKLEPLQVGSLVVLLFSISNLLAVRNCVDADISSLLEDSSFDLNKSTVELLDLMLSLPVVILNRFYFELCLERSASSALSNW